MSKFPKLVVQEAASILNFKGVDAAICNAATRNTACSRAEVGLIERVSVSPASNLLVSSTVPTGPVLFYDGECGLCNRVVRVLLRFDRRGVLCFAPLQGATAQAYLRAQGLPTEDFDSLVFVPDWTRREHAEFLLRTDGALAAVSMVGGWGRALAWVRVVPKSWRDAGYKIVARWRYRIWGQWTARPLARPEWAARFLV